MGKRILFVILVMLGFELMYFYDSENIECMFITMFLFFWVAFEIILEYTRTVYFSDGHYQEYRTFSYDENVHIPKSTYTPPKFTYEPKAKRTFGSFFEKDEDKVLKLIKPNMSIVLKDSEKTEVMNTHKKTYLDKMKQGKLTFCKITVPTVTKPTTYIPTVQTEKKDFNYNPSFAHSVIVIDNDDNLSDKKQNVYNAIINALKNAKLTTFAIREVLKNIHYVDLIEASDSSKYKDEVVIYFDDCTVLKKHNISFVDIEKNIKEKCDTIGKVLLDTILTKTVLSYFDSQSQ